MSATGMATVVWLTVCAVLVTVTSAQQSKPNLVFMLVDDWGWANVGYHRDPPTKEVVTPNIDGIVKEGLELDQHYVFKFCSPSRSCLMSGRLPIHVNDQNAPPNIYNPQDPVSGFAGIPRNMTGLATKMKLAGYAAHQVGKWDAGMATPDHIPIGRRFDTSFGYYHHANDFYTEIASACNGTGMVDLWDTDKPAHGVNGTGPDKYEEGLFKERLLKIVNDHDTSTPLFLYYAPHIVHTPLEVPDSYASKFSFIDDKDRQMYRAMVNYLDDVVGELVDALKKKGMWENMLFASSSDNGGPEYPGGGANNYPLKGGKLSNWQGYLVAIFLRRCVVRRRLDTSIWLTGMPPFVLLLVLIQLTRELLKPTFLPLTASTCGHSSPGKQQSLLVKMFQSVLIHSSVVNIRSSQGRSTKQDGLVLSTLTRLIQLGGLMLRKNAVRLGVSTTSCKIPKSVSTWLQRNQTL